MKRIGAGAVGSGIVCGIWAYVSAKLSMSYPDLFATWLGFVGITSFFTAGASKSAVFRSSASNIMGVIIGCTIIALSNIFPDSVLFSAVVTGFFTWVICYIVHIDLLRYAPCTFMGGFSAFATGGNWEMVVVCTIIGNIAGYLCVKLGNLIYDMTAKENDDQEEWSVLKLFDD